MEKSLKAESEVVLALSDNHPTIVRPLIRLQDRNIILTRINPQVRDTSVLVRLRPAWEDLRSYLTAKGRKRFEVFVCTMAERDYALEMWRLLDPDSNLISPRELIDRIVCVVKSGSRKSLFNVFQDGNCHPRMALVIDDRLKVWDEQDQPRLHVVPAFMPYFAPQAEANNTIPVLCVARNVACNVRGGFFKEFDDGLMQRISEVAYEDDINGAAPSVEFNSGSFPVDNHRTHYTPYVNKVETSIPPGRVLESQRLSKKEFPREDMLRPPRPNFPAPGEDSPAAQHKEPDTEAGQIDPYSETFTGALQDIALKCGTRVEYRQSLVSSVDLQFSVEVFFAGEKVGEGTGGMRREAQHHAAERSLLYLADKYLSQLKPDFSKMAGDGSRLGKVKDNDLIGENSSLSYQALPEEPSTASRIRDPRIDASKKATSSIAALKDLCSMECLSVAFQTRPQFSARGQKNEVYAEV